MNWLWIALIVIYIHKRFDLACLIPIPMFSLLSWFLYYSTCSKSTKSIKPMGTLLRNGRYFCLLFWKKNYFIEKLYVSLLITFLEKFFAPQEYRLNNATVWETPMLKNYLNSWKSSFLAWQFIENQAFKIFAFFSMCQRI